MKTTTVQIPIKTKKELDSFKDFERQTYAGVIDKLIDIVKEDEESKLELSNETLKVVKEAREDVNLPALKDGAS